MKKVFSLLLIILISQNSFSQETKSGFNINRMFAGGSLVLGLGFGNNSTLQLGANPEIGYSLTKWFDAGINFNTIYTRLKYRQDYSPYYTVTQSSFNYGVGVFARLHLANSIFIQAQPEINWIDYKITADEIPNYEQKEKVKAGSFLVGIGYGSRDVGQANFFTVIMIDLQKELYSPYRTNAGEIMPIMRGGMNFYFGRKKKRN